MAAISEERISHLAHVVLDAIRGDVKVVNERVALLEIKKSLSTSFQLEDRLDDAVRARIPGNIPPGSRQWDILYRKYMEEERRKT